MKCDECGKERAGFLFGGTNENGEKCGNFFAFSACRKELTELKRA